MVVALEEALINLILVLITQVCRVLWHIQVTRHINGLQLVIRRRSHGNFMHAILQILQHECHSLALLAALVQVDHLLGWLVGSAELDDDARAELLATEVLEAGRNDDGHLTRVHDGAERHEGNASLERQQVRLVVRASLREHGDGTATSEHILDTLKHLTLINLRQHFEFVPFIRIEAGHAGLLQSNLGVTHNLSDNLLFDFWLARLANCEKLIAFGKLLGEVRVVADHSCDVIEGDLAGTFLGEVGRTLDRN